MTKEKVEKLEAERDTQAQQITELSGLSAKTLWQRDLDAVRPPPIFYTKTYTCA